MTVLVTGGAGYIGAHTVRALRAADREVVVLDTLERGNRQAVVDTELIVGDTADQRLVAKICKDFKITSVIHFAAYKAVGESMIKPEMYWSNNVASTEKLLAVLAENRVDKFVFSSSAAVYGTPKSVPVTESASAAPESVYAETKLAVEKYLGTLTLNSVSLRYFNAAGASSDNKIGEDWSASQNLIPQVMRALLDSAFKFEIYGNDYDTPDGTCIRDYIHVEDLAMAHLKALEYLESGGRTLVCNIGTGQGTSVTQLIDLTEKIANRKVPFTVAARRSGDPVSVYADASLAVRTLGWQSTRSLHNILESAYTWHSTHPNGYR